MAGWMRGLVYGTYIKAERYSLYVDGKAVTNMPLIQLAKKQDGSKLPVFATSAMTANVYDKGRAKLSSGEAFISFTEAFLEVIDNPTELIITVTPMGNTNGLYVSEITSTGFYVKENNSGASTVEFSWIAVGTQSGYENIEIPAEVLTDDYEIKMNGVMFNDYNLTDTPQPIWWDGTQIRFDAIPTKSLLNKQAENTRIPLSND
jgi:hypothetical protein